MKMIRLLIFLFTSCLFSLSAKSDESKKNAIWIWQLEGSSREIYLVGELHALIGDIKSQYDYSKLKNLTSASTVFWIESMQKTTTFFEENVAIKNQIDLTAWKTAQISIQKAVEKILRNTSGEAVHRKFSDDFISAVSALDPIQAASEIGNLNFLLYRKKTPDAALVFPGFRAQLLKDNKFRNNIQEIEKNNSVAKAWRESCTERDAELLLQAVIEDLNNENLPGYKIQKIFLEPKSEISDLDKALNESTEGKLLQKCSIFPRNKIWLPEIKKILSTPGPTTVFLFGIGHYAGENGLIRLLQDAGYKEIRRLY
jgi:uncharacterized protein YbaP (TraB family)